MALKNREQRDTIDPSRALPLLAWIGKGTQVNGRPTDTDSFHLTPKPAWETIGDWRDPYTGELLDKPLSQLWFDYHRALPKKLEKVYLLTSRYDDDISYQAFMEDWRARESSRFIVRKCDEQQIVQWMMPDSGGEMSYDPKPCERESKDNPCQCKLSARLRFRLPKFSRYAGLPIGYYELQTGAWYDDRSIFESLRYIQSAYPMPLDQIPLTLWREPKKKSFVDAKGVKRSRTAYVIRVSVDADFAREWEREKRRNDFIFAAADTSDETYMGTKLDPLASDVMEIKEVELPPETQPIANVHNQSSHETLDTPQSSENSPPAPVPHVDTEVYMDEVIQAAMGQTWAELWATVNGYPDDFFPQPVPTIDEMVSSSDNLYEVQFRVLRILAHCAAYIRIPAVTTIARGEKGKEHFFMFGEVKVRFFSRGVFRQANYPNALIDDMGEIGTLDMEVYGFEAHDCPEGRVKQHYRDKKTGDPMKDIYFTVDRILDFDEG